MEDSGGSEGVVVAITNQKGGVGKTTTAVNCAAMAGCGGFRVLVVDLDPQANTSSVLLPDWDGPSALDGAAPQATDHEGVDLLPSGLDLVDQETRLAGSAEPYGVLRRTLDPLRSEYDLILVDCPPSLNVLPLNALHAADGVLIPIQCEYYAMEGLGQILATIQDLQEAAEVQEGGAQLGFCRILLCMYEEGLSLSREVAEEVRKHLGDQVLPTAIPRDVALAAAPSHNRSALQHDPLSPGAVAYLAATKELLNVIER